MNLDDNWVNPVFVDPVPCAESAFYLLPCIT
jgi:hypothetical protein